MFVRVCVYICVYLHALACLCVCVFRCQSSIPQQMNHFRFLARRCRPQKIVSYIFSLFVLSSSLLMCANPTFSLCFFFSNTTCTREPLIFSLSLPLHRYLCVQSFMLSLSLPLPTTTCVCNPTSSPCLSLFITNCMRVCVNKTFLFRRTC